MIWKASRPVPRRPMLWRVVCALLLVSVLGLAGCSSIPMSGPVGKSDSDGGSEPFEDYRYNPRGPQPDADAQSIVEGFINAGTGIQDDFKVARQFLAPGIAKTWKPDERTLVSSKDPKISPTKSGSKFTIKLQLARIVDGNGILHSQPAGSTENIDVKLTKVDGQWRIADIPDGLMLSTADFSALFRPQTLYFYDPTFTFGVPDVRWFVANRSASASAVRVLLKGPAPYLKGAVVSAFPEGSMLARPSVPIDAEKGKATVDLTSQVLEGTTSAQRRRMLGQLEMTLVGSNTISSVSMTVEQREVKMGTAAESAPVAIRDKQVPDTQIAIVDKELRYYDDGQVNRIDKVPSVAALAPQDPAMAASAKAFAFLNGDRDELLTVAPGGVIKMRHGGAALTAPSFDPWNWVWTANGDGSGRVTSVPFGDGNKDTVQVNAEWLSGKRVTELKISRDGARALIIAAANGKSEVYISGVIRSADGSPKALVEPISLQPGVPVDSGAWLGETSVVVMKASADAEVKPEILRLDGEPQDIAALHGMLNISAGNSAQQIYGQTGAAIFGRSGNSWSQQVPGVTEPSFAG